MSVLLDALKKAAEEKNKSSEGGQDLNASIGDELESSASLKLTKPEREPEQVSETMPATESEPALEQASVAAEELSPTPSEPDGKDAASETVEPSTSARSESSAPSADKGGEVQFKVITDPPEHAHGQSELSNLIDELDTEDNLSSETTRPVQSTETAGVTSVTPAKAPEKPVEKPSSKTEPEQYAQAEASPATEDKDSFEWSMDTLPGYAQQTAKDASSEPKNPILVSGQNTPPRPSKKVSASTGTVVTLLVFVLFVGIGVYGMFYYQEQNEELEFSMRKYDIAKVDIAPVAPEKTEAAQATAGDAQEATQTEQAQPQADSTPVASEAGDAEGAAATDIAGAGDASSEIAAEESSESVQQVVASDQSESSPSASSTATSNTSSKATAKKAVSTKKRATKRKQLAQAQIKKNTELMTLANGYDAYKQGSYATAEGAFTQVLADSPNNSSALIAMGSIRQMQGELHEALDYFQQALDAEPNNLSAFEAIANLSGQLALNKQWFEEVSAMGKRYPTSSVLQTAIGNYHVQQGDWLAAQEAYFKAYSLNVKSADNMMNLAVSYDHLGEYELASKYYISALAEADKQAVGFDPAEVKARLVSIRQFVVKGP